MINVIATNFGIEPEIIDFRTFESPEIMVINGSFHVDTTLEAFKAAGILRSTVDELPFARSKETAVFVINDADGAHDITLTNAWLENGNTICIKPVLKYASLPQYQLCFYCAFMPENNAGLANYAEHYIDEPIVEKGEFSDLMVQRIEDTDWMELIIRATSITFDSGDNTASVRLEDCPDLNLDFLPIIYTNSISDAMGSKFYPASFHYGVLTIDKDGSADEDAGSFNKFTKVFIIK